MAMPSKYKPEFCKRLIAHMAKGGSFEGFGGVVGIGKTQLFDWLKKFPEFKEAKETAELASRLYWDNIGIKAVKGGIENFNATVWIFTYKNRFGWRDKWDVDSTEKPNEVQKDTKKNVEKLAKLYTALASEKNRDK